MGKHDTVKGKLATCILHDDSKHDCVHHIAENRIENHLKTQRHPIPEPRFVAENITEGSPVCDVAKRLAGGMVSDLTSNVAAYAAKLFVEMLVVMLTIPLVTHGSCRG